MFLDKRIMNETFSLLQTFSGSSILYYMEHRLAKQMWMAENQSLI